MPVSGTDLGTVFNQGYGTGSSELLDSGAMVNVARDLYNQENQWNKLAQQEKRQVDRDVNKIMSSPMDSWTHDQSELVPEFNTLLEKAAKYKSKVSNPFTGFSNDPEVQQFQQDWRNLQNKAGQSVLDRTEFSKYQSRLAETNAKNFDPKSVKEVADYYALPISKRVGKTPPSLRLKDPTSNFWSLASQTAKESEKKEFTDFEIDDLIDKQINGDNELKTKIGSMAQEAFSNYSKKDKENAIALYGEDEKGNPNYVEMGRSLYKDNLKGATNVKDYDITKEFEELAKRVGNTTTRTRATDGTMFLDTNTGEAAKLTYEKAKQIFAAKLNSPLFAQTFNDLYGSEIKTDDLKNMPIEEAKKIAKERAIELGAKRIFDYKDTKKEAVARLSTNITVNTGDKNKNSMSNVFEEFMSDTLNNDNNARTYGVIKGQPLGEYGYVKEIKPQSFAIQGEGIKRPNLKVVLVDKNGTETTQDFDMTKPMNKAMFGHALEKGLQAKENLDSYNSDGKQSDPLGIKKSATKTQTADPLGLR